MSLATFHRDKRQRRLVCGREKNVSLYSFTSCLRYLYLIAITKPTKKTPR
jgi:hypothetical protein